MAVLPKCPSCGLESDEVRCPRCNTLKVLGCTGSCTFCGSHSDCKVKVPAPPGARPSDAARDDDEHPGTPLER